MAAQFGHEALAEMHDFPVRFAFRVEVRAAFAAADGKAGQGVLEDLFKSQELQDAQVDALVEAQAAFVRADGAVGLDAVAAVDVEDAVVIFPGDAENDDAFRFDDAFQDVVLFIFRFLFSMGTRDVSTSRAAFWNSVCSGSRRWMMASTSSTYCCISVIMDSPLNEYFIVMR